MSEIEFLPVQVHLEAVHVPQHAHGADPALDLGLVGDVALPLGNVRLLVVPLQMGHDLRDVLGGERAEVALKRIPRYTLSDQCRKVWLLYTG